MIEEVKQFSREWEEFWYNSESEAREFMRPQFSQNDHIALLIAVSNIVEDPQQKNHPYYTDLKSIQRRLSSFLSSSQ